MVDVHQAALPAVTVELPDLHADPRFIDPASGDYRLAAYSPALDAGTAPGDYRWYKAHSPCTRFSCPGPAEPEFERTEYPQPGPETVLHPVDGSGDGTAEHDIGAFDYQL